MFIWIGVFAIGLGLSIWWEVVSTKKKNEGRQFLSALLIACFSIGILSSIGVGDGNYNQAIRYSLRIPEIQNVVPSSDYEGALLTVEKHDINTWVYNAKILRTAYGIFSFYPKLVLDLPIIPVP